MNPTYEEIEAKIALLEVQLKLSEAAERACESSMMQACGEDGPKSVADKFAELESKLETALRECRSAGITIDNLEAKCAALASENAGLKAGILQASEDMEAHHDDHGLFSYDADGEQMDALLRLCDAQESIELLENVETPATDAFLAEVRAQGVDMARNAMIDFVDGEVGPNKNVPGLIRGAEICVSIADQLRQGEAV